MLKTFLFTQTNQLGLGVSQKSTAMSSTKETHLVLAQYVTPAYFQQIDDLTSQIHADYVTNLKEITRYHWKPKEGKLTCFNRSCRKQFSLLDRPHHCRKCGEVFCAKCLAYQRRLNRLAHFDPDGELHKVCQICFEKDKLLEGQTRSLTQDFAILRKRFKEKILPDYNPNNPSGWRNKINFDRECQRLIQGFEKSVGHSELRRAFHEVKSIVSVPDWMKSSFWVLENLASVCQLCGKQPSRLSNKLWCRVCGVVTCSNCSNKDLLLYVPDEERDVKVKDRVCHAHLAVIKIVGCPSVEPEVSLYLRVCLNCKERLIQRQVMQSYENEKTDSSKEDFLDELVNLHAKFRQNEERVTAMLPKYKEVAESLVDSSRTSSSQTNMKTLAKAQEDLADVLAQHITVVQRLKQLRPCTDSQSSLLKTYIKAKCDFYLENMSLFRSIKHRLSESVPAESLDFILRVMDKNAIISTHLYLRQLVYETIHLCSKYGLEETIPPLIMEAEAQVEFDVSNCLKAQREDVNEHMEIVKEMIKSRMKSNCLIRPSRRQIEIEGATHVQQMMVCRAVAILSQVNLQLQLASAHRSFNKSKDALDKVLARMQTETGNPKEKDGFVFVS